MFFYKKTTQITGYFCDIIHYIGTQNNNIFMIKIYKIFITLSIHHKTFIIIINVYFKEKFTRKKSYGIKRYENT